MSLAQALARGVSSAPSEDSFGRLGIKGKNIAIFASITQVQAPRVYPENFPVWSLFVGLQTQWLIVAGMGGAHHIGMPYPAVESALRLRGTPRREWPGLFADLRVLEVAWLAEKSRLASQRRPGA